MSDLISRQESIDAFWKLDIELRPSAMDAILEMLWQLPSAQPENCEYCRNLNKTMLLIPQPTQTNTPNALKALDCVERQAAIDTITNANFNVTISGRRGFQNYKEEFEKAFVAIRGKYIEALKALPSAQPETHDKCTETHDVSFEKQRIVTGPLNELWKKWAKEKDDYSLREYKLKLAYSAGFEDGLRAKREGKENE